MKLDIPFVEPSPDVQGRSDMGWPQTHMKFVYQGEKGSWAAIHCSDGIEVELGPATLVAGGAGTLGIVLAALAFLGNRYAPEQYAAARDAFLDLITIGDGSENKDKPDWFKIAFPLGALL